MLLQLLRWFCPVILLIAATACHYNPTDDYVIVEPVTLMPRWSANLTWHIPLLALVLTSPIQTRLSNLILVCCIRRISRRTS